MKSPNENQAKQTKRRAELPETIQTVDALRWIWQDKELKCVENAQELAEKILEEFRKKLIEEPEEFLGNTFVGYTLKSVTPEIDDFELGGKWDSTGDFDSEEFEEITAYKKEEIEPDCLVSGISKFKINLLAKTLQKMGFTVYLKKDCYEVLLMVGLNREKF